jgi:outer membrane protein assembly factor BamB
MNLRSCSTGLLLLAALLNVAVPADEKDTNADEDKPSVSHVLYPPSRDLRQLFTRAEEAVEESRFADAIQLLGKLARSLASRDYFVTESTSRTAKGFKSEFHRAMDSLPREARDAYENLFGAESQALLDGAIEQHDFARLESVFQTWQHTHAGQEAALLLARLRLDRGQPALTVAYLERLAASPDRASIEPELSVLLARSLLQLRRPDKATAVLDQLRGLLPQATIEVRGEAISLFQEGTDPSDVIAEQAPRSRKHAADGWHSYRGHVSGHTTAEPIRLPLRQLWRVAIDNETLQDQWQQYIDRDAPALPVLSPLSASGHIVIRTSTHLLAIDSGHGRTTWQYPPLGPSTLDEENENNERDENQLTQRVWYDASYGRTSSDGSRLFLIDGLDTAADPSEIAKAARLAMFREQEPLKVKSHNVLVALDLTREGAFLWMVGDETGEGEPETAGAYFLGPPLPLDGRLYALVEMDSAVHLVVLDAVTGKKQWSLPVAQLDSQQAISKNPTRRFFGATPVYDNGVLICPSSAGAIAAVDLANRSYLWGFQYRTAPRTSRPSAGGGWADPTVVVAGENVLVSLGQDDLYCLDFANGAERWHKRRSDSLYLATVGENVLLIGRHRFSAIRVGDGELAWDTPFVAIPAGGMPSGRGMFDGRYYYLPTTDRELLQIDVSSGTVIARHRIDEALGNLIGRQGSLVSQSPDRKQGQVQFSDNVIK